MKYNLSEIEKAAQWLFEIVNDYKVIAFEGKMGAGKTTLIKSLCQLLDVADNVSSPTFAIINEYGGAKIGPIYHFDFYRLNKKEEALDLGLFDYLESGNLCLIEWYSKVEEYLPNDLVIVKIDEITETQREITIKYC